MSYAASGPARPAGRITFLINSMEGGGAERAMATLLHHLVPHLAPARVELVLLDDLPSAQTLPADLAVTILDGRGRLLHSLLALYRHWRRPDRRPDLCISFLARANVVNVLLARRFGHRAIISERVQTSSHIAASRAAPLLAAVTRWTYARADHVVAVSQGVADDLSGRFGVDAGRISVIGNIVDADRLRHMAQETPAVDLPDDFFVGLGRLVPNKNFDMSITAYARLPADAPPLVILGQGPEEAALRARAASLGVSGKVLFPGFLPNPYPIVARARALVSASRAEGFPNTLIEAMALECPVIATDCPSGPAEILMGSAQAAPPWSGRTAGILVAMEDVGAMEAAFRTFLSDETRAEYASRATRRASEFGIDPVVDSYKALVFSSFRAAVPTAGGGNP